nr:hypothetical protein [Sedimentibacter sp.]
MISWKDILNIEFFVKLVICLAVLKIALSGIYKYLVKNDKIKPSKISILFYYDDESIIDSWEKIKEKGMLKYIIRFSIYPTIYMGIAGVVFKLNNRAMFGFEQNQAIVIALIIGFIIGIICGLMRWNELNKRYIKLKEKL